MQISVEISYFRRQSLHNVMQPSIYDVANRLLVYCSSYASSQVLTSIEIVKSGCQPILALARCRNVEADEEVKIEVLSQP